MDCNLEKGQHITLIVYNGPSKDEAQAMYDYLVKIRYEGILIPIEDTPFSLDIQDFSLVQTYEPTGYKDIYEVEVKGEVKC